MKIVRNPLLPPKGFLAINLFGLCFCRRDAVITKRVVNHESIHTAQMRELLYVGFYVLYVAEWLYRLLRIRSSYDAYMAVSFEREAYRHDGDDSYLKQSISPGRNTFWDDLSCIHANLFFSHWVE